MSTYSSAIIDGNVITDGYSVTTLTPTIHTYDRIINTNTVSTITNNVLSGISSNSSTSRMLVLGSASNYCSCVVTGNRFVRGTASINAYVYSTGAYSHTITDNSFDLPTVDGTVETLASGLVASSRYERNTNQTYYTAVKFDETTMDDTVSYRELIGSYDTGVLQIFTFKNKDNSNTVSKISTFRINLNNALPENVRILNVAIGVCGTTGSNDIDTLNIRAYLNTTLATSFSPSAPGSTALLDVYNTIVATNYGIDSAQTITSNLVYAYAGVSVTAFPLSSQYLSVDATAATIISGKNNNQIQLQLTYDAIILAGNTKVIKINNSPALVKYRWM